MHSSCNADILVCPFNVLIKKVARLYPLLGDVRWKRFNCICCAVIFSSKETEISPGATIVSVKYTTLGNVLLLTDFAAVA